MYCYSDKNMKLHRKFVQDFNGRRVPDGENVARSFWYEIFFGKLRPASLEIDLVRPPPWLGAVRVERCGIQRVLHTVSGAGLLLLLLSCAWCLVRLCVPTVLSF